MPLTQGGRACCSAPFLLQLLSSHDSGQQQPWLPDHRQHFAWSIASTLTLLCPQLAVLPPLLPALALVVVVLLLRLRRALAPPPPPPPLLLPPPAAGRPAPGHTCL
jgi:hypothetical protein